MAPIELRPTPTAATPATSSIPRPLFCGWDSTLSASEIRARWWKLPRNISIISSPKPPSVSFPMYLRPQQPLPPPSVPAPPEPISEDPSALLSPAEKAGAGPGPS